MNIYMVENPYKFDVEQTAIILMPERKPRVTESPAPRARIAEDFAISELKVGKKSATAKFSLQLDGKFCAETCISVFKGDESKQEIETEIRNTLRRSVYKAYVTLTGNRPAWGALAGVRPTKLARRHMEKGLSADETKKLLVNRYYIRPDKAEMSVSAAICAQKLKKNLSENDAALYVGIPYCPTRCAYCSFISKAAPDAKTGAVQKYLSVLEQEIAETGERISEAGVRLQAVYIGGGTPTVLSPEQLSSLLCAIKRSFELAEGCEFTVEAGRPDTITSEKLGAIRENGANRLSINPQTFSNRVLKNIGRGHSVDDIYNAFELVRGIGGFSVNMDLIAGLPGDSFAGFAKSVKNAIELEPENITVHTLALKRGSSFAENGFLHMPPETIAEMLSNGADMLAKAGYEPYYLYRQKYSGGSFENVGYAKDDQICRYNVYMMDELLPVIACGAGAVTKLTFDREQNIIRISNPKYPEDYIAKSDEIMESKAKLAAFYAK
jgi:oxygen-independent coproporphyrinogen-3 oxidase